MARYIRLPKTMAQWPLPRRVSPFYDEVSGESAEWFRSFHAFRPGAQKAFDRCKFGLLAALSYPTAEKEHYRAACDLMNLFFVFDDYTDELGESDVRKLADISMDALRNPSQPRPVGESVIGEIARQFWARALKLATETSRVRFEGTWDRFTASIVEQARDRDSGRSRTIEEHMELRRYTIGAEPCYALAELPLNLPEELVNHPLIQSLKAAITDIIIFDNDLSSYSKEQAAGDDAHNVITIAMREYNLDLDGALSWLAEQHKARADHAIAIWPKTLALAASESDPNTGGELALYIDHVMNWPRANDCWNFESGRYFGQIGLEIQQSRLVEMLPRGQKQAARL